MVRVLMFLVVSAVVFAAGVVTSYLTVGKPPIDKPRPLDFAEAVPAAAVDSEEPTMSPTTDLPTIVREQPLSPEELFRFSALFQKQKETLDRQRQSLEQRQQRIQLMEEDMRRARLELDGLRAETADVIEQGEALLQQIQQERAQTVPATTASDPNAGPTEDAQSRADSHLQNVKQISRWFQSMPPERAAEYLQELSNDGKLSSAVELLGHIEERDAAKILAQVPDATLVVQITEAFKELKRPPKKKR